MKHRHMRKILLFAALAMLCLPLFVQADEWRIQSLGMADSGGNAVTDSAFSVVGDYSVAAGGPSLFSAIRPTGKLARADFQKVYDEAWALLQIGEEFRRTNLQLPPNCSTLNECLRNYSDLNGGQLFHQFCEDYEAINGSGSCAPDNIRTGLVRARDNFGFLIATDPPDLMLNQGLARDLGRTGVLSATREIAYVHLIFGNEFLVDALDYRFSGGDPRADAIIRQEIAQLDQALQQFNLATSVLIQALNFDYGGANSTYAADFFTARDYELFGIVSERMIVTLIELAARYRMLGDDNQAIEKYNRAFADQYVQILTLASSARDNQMFLDNGGWRLLNNLEQLRAQTQVINEGINPFGFTADYVPLQTYGELLDRTRNTFLRDATEDEREARDAQREFDQNANQLRLELERLRLTYGERLAEICGRQSDYARTCDGGLMRQNYFNTLAAIDRVRLANEELANNLRRIENVHESANREISLILANGEQIALIEYAKGVASSQRTTDITIESNSAEVYGGVEARLTMSASANPFGCAAGGCGIKQDLSLYAGGRWARTKTSSTQTIIDPTEEKLGTLNSLQAVQQAASQAAIVRAKSEGDVRNLLLAQSELLIQRDITLKEYNRLVAEHDDLRDTWHRWLNLRKLAEENTINSYLTNPAYRILRDGLTVEAARSQGLAAQFAYLTAKALEYEFLTPVPFLNDIFKARTADDIDNFLNQLEQLNLVLPRRDRYPYHISVARELLGLSDANLDPTGSLTPTERAQLRFERFQEFLQQHLVKDTNTGAVVAVEFPFTTSLLDNRIFSPNIWNNRIAGVGEPAEVPGTQGVALNLVTRQFGDIGTPEVVLTHGGHATYRDVRGDLLTYTPTNARLAGYVVPPGFENKTRTAIILSSVNGNSRGTRSGVLFNLSVAASSWTVRVDLKSPSNKNLDITQLEDIEIDMDTTGIALPRLERQAQEDAQRLQAVSATR